MKTKILVSIIGLLSLTTLIFSQSNISLTASDGTGLEMRALKVSSVIDGMVAFTEIEMTFFNPENRQREGRFSILLPSNASISRFAMKIKNYWQEGEVVEKQKARRVYEEFLHRRQDPALLEQDSGNFFRARVFPIAPNSEKKLIISYSELLINNNSTYSFPLKGLPKLNNLDIKVFFKGDTNNDLGVVSSLGGNVKNWKVMNVKKEDYKPSEDFILQFPFANKEIYSLRSNNICAVKFKPISDEVKVIKEDIKNWVVLFDTSASQSLNYKEHVDRLSKLFESIFIGSKPDLVKIYAFDQDLISIGECSSIEGLKKIIISLKNRIPLGASNFEKAFNKLSDKIKDDNSRLLIISDGVSTAGLTKSNELKKILSNIKKVKRTDCISFSTYQDDKFLQDIVNSSIKGGQVFNNKMNNELIKDKLLRTTIQRISINVPNAEWYWPTHVESIQPGDEVILFAEILDNKPFKIEFNGKSISLESSETEALLLKREWVHARLKRLLFKEKTSTDKDMKNAFHNEIIRLSETERVLCPYTALLVLETENDYKRYNIKRNALADILTIGASGIEVLERKSTDLNFPAPIKRREPPVRIMKKAKQEVSRASSVDSAQEGLQFLLFEEIPASVVKAAERSREMDDKDMESSQVLQDSFERKEVEVEQMRVHVSVPAESSLEAVSIVPHSDEIKYKKGPNPLSGKYKEARELMQNDNLKNARNFVLSWYNENPGDAIALIALGEVEAKIGNIDEALRSFGSLIDLFPSRADIRRWAAGRLFQFKEGIPLAIDSLEKAKSQRDLHPSVYHLLSIGYILNGQMEAAINTLVEGLNKNFPNRFPAIKRILSENISLILSSSQGKYLLKDNNIQKLIKKYNIKTNLTEQIRFILTWETDANDVDFHIYDGFKNHAYYQSKTLKTGGSLYADVTGGYGPECFTIEKPKAFPYRLQANYYSRGPMGYGMGLVQIIRLEESKKLSVESRPFIIMQDGAFVEIGTVEK